MGAVSFRDTKLTDYENIYYHDYHGWRDTMPNCTEAFNTFIPEKDETLTAVSFFTAADDVNYTVKIFDRFEGGALLDELSAKSGRLDYTGFHTIDLDTYVPLQQNDSFHVYVQLSGGGHPLDRTSEIPVLLNSDYPVGKDPTEGTVVISAANPNERHYMSGSEWLDLYDYNFSAPEWDHTANFCIKALISTDSNAPAHSDESPPPDSYKDVQGTNISVRVTDPSGVNGSSVQLFVNGSTVTHALIPIPNGYDVSYWIPGFSLGVVACRIVADDVLGNHLDFAWNFSILASYVIPLKEGWNMVSIPLEQVDTSVTSVLASIEGLWEVVKYYDSTDARDHWKTYRPGAATNDLTDIDHRMGFWIKITGQGVNLAVIGIVPTATNIPLYAGWNLVGYPTQATETLGNAMWGTGADMADGFEAETPYIKEIGPGYVMKPGEGYWIHVAADTVWRIDW
jgi:hypothetical protein